MRGVCSEVCANWVSASSGLSLHSWHTLGSVLLKASAAGSQANC